MMAKWIVGLALLTLFAVLNPIPAEAAPAGASATLSVTVLDLGATNGVRNDVTYAGTKARDRVRVQGICQAADSSVVWAQAVTVGASPISVYFLGVPGGLQCRSDVLLVSGGGKVKVLATQEWSA